MEDSKISGIVTDSKIARISVLGMRDKPGLAFKIFTQLAMAKINVDIILNSIAADDFTNISFTVAKRDLEAAISALEKSRKVIGFKEISFADNLAKVSIIGAGMMSTPGVAAQMFEALYAAKINIEAIATSEIKISVLVSEKDAKRAVEVIHTKFFVE
jgi:aspartate kinase